MDGTQWFYYWRRKVEQSSWKVGTFIFLLVTIESMLFLAMQVRVMAACMESQIGKQEYTASAQSRARDGTGGINQPSDVCGGNKYKELLQNEDASHEVTPFFSMRTVCQASSQHWFCVDVILQSATFVELQEHLGMQIGGFIYSPLLPPAYVVRREGTVFTGVCLSTGGGGGGLPDRVPPRGGPGTPRGGGGGGVPDRVPPRGGVPS